MPADFRIEAQGKSSVRVWAISKLSAPLGNEMTFHYLEDGANGDYVIDEIRYNFIGGAAATKISFFSPRQRTTKRPSTKRGAKFSKYAD